MKKATLFFLLVFVSSSVFVFSKDIYYSVVILPFKGYGKKAENYGYLSSLIQKSLYIATIKQYKYRYVEVDDNTSSIEDYINGDVGIYDNNYFQKLLEGFGVEFIIYGVYVVGDRGGLTIKAVFMGKYKDKEIVKRFQRHGEIGPMMFETVDLLASDIVGAMNRYFPKRTEEEKKEIIKQIKKIELSLRTQTAPTKKEKTRVEVYRQGIYLLGGYPFLFGISSSEGYLSQGKELPFEEFKGVFSLELGYINSYFVKRFLKSDRFLSGVSLGFLYSNEDIYYVNTNLPMNIKGNMVDLGLFLGYTFNISENVSFAPFFGGGASFQVFFFEGSVFTKGVWGYALFGAFVSIPLYDRMSFMGSLKIGSYIYSLYSYLFSVNTLLGISWKL